MPKFEFGQKQCVFLNADFIPGAHCLEARLIGMGGAASRPGRRLPGGAEGRVCLPLTGRIR